MLRRGEGETIEFKKSFAEQEAAVKTLGAMASQQGGMVVVGVSPSGDVVGVSVGSNTLEMLARAIHDKINPPVQVSIADRAFRGKTVYTVSVIGDGRLRSVDGRFYKRVGRTTLQLGAEEIRARFRAEESVSAARGQPMRDEWLERHRAAARDGLSKVGLPGCFEILLRPEPGLSPTTQQALMRHAEASMIQTFGWPMGIVLHDERRPRPATDGIFASVPVTDDDAHKSYDYWALRSDGTFYTLRSYFEDDRGEPGTALYFNTRIVNVAEAFLYARNLYGLFGAGEHQAFAVWTRHDGLEGRVLTSSGGRRHRPGRRTASENAVETEIRVRLDEIEGALVQNVKSLVAPVFTMFDFAEFNDSVYADIVTNFADGRVT